MARCTISLIINVNRIYYAGQTLSGTVELYLQEAKKCRGLRLAIEGAANCKWKEQVRTSDGSRTVTYRGSEQYLNNVSFLFGAKGGVSERIEAGVHTYSFSCFLPFELPSSYEAARGSIRYKVYAILDIPWGVDANTENEFTVLRHDDLNLQPDLRLPCQEEDIKTFCCLFCKSKPMLLEASIPHSGYIPGDTVNVAIKVINRSNKKVLRCQLELYQFTKCTSEEGKKHHEIEVLVKVEAQGVDKSAMANFNKELFIPLTLTKTNVLVCNILQIFYAIKVSCKTEGFSKNPKVFIPITIGSVPLSFGQTVEPNIALSLLASSSIYMPPPSFEQAMNESKTDVEAEVEAEKNIGWTIPT